MAGALGSGEGPSTQTVLLSHRWVRRSNPGGKRALSPVHSLVTVNLENTGVLFCPDKGGSGALIPLSSWAFNPCFGLFGFVYFACAFYLIFFNTFITDPREKHQQFPAELKHILIFFSPVTR